MLTNFFYVLCQHIWCVCQLLQLKVSKIESLTTRIVGVVRPNACAADDRSDEAMATQVEEMFCLDGIVHGHH